MKARRTMEKLLDGFPGAPDPLRGLRPRREPERAEKDHVVFTPTLVKLGPEPRAWIVGDLSDPAVVADIIHMCGIEPVRHDPDARASAFEHGDERRRIDGLDEVGLEPRLLRPRAVARQAPAGEGDGGHALFLARAAPGPCG